MQWRMSRGYTLIELLLALAIAGLALTFVGPFTINQHERAKVLQEQQTLQQIFSFWRFKAALYQQPVVFHVNHNSLNVTLETSTVLYEHQFEYLKFEEQWVSVNANGFWRQPYLHIQRPSSDHVEKLHLDSMSVSYE